MLIEGDLANLPPVVLEQLEQLHAEIADLCGQLKQKGIEQRDVRRMSPEEYRREKGQIRSGVRERERKPVLAEGVTDVRALTADEYADAFYKATGCRYRPRAKGVAYGTRRVVRGESA